MHPKHCLLLAVLLYSHAHAALVGGLSINEIAPPEFAASTVLSIKTDAEGRVWYSNGKSLFSVNRDGSNATSESLVDLVGQNSVTPDLAIDSAGRQFVGSFLTGVVYKRDSPMDAWHALAGGLGQIRAIDVAPNGDLVIASGEIVEQGLSSLVAVSQSGEVRQIASGLNSIESFAFDGHGNVVFADYLTGDLYRVAVEDGQVQHIGNGKAIAGLSLIEAIAVTDDGHILLGINTGACADDCDFGGNTNRLDRFDPVSGKSIVLGSNYTSLGCCGYRLPVDFDIDRQSGELMLAAFGSIVPMAISGDLDGDFGNGLNGAVISLPGSLLLALGGLGALACAHRRGLHSA